MAHELATTGNGRSAMMYYGKEPWHGLGTRLDRPATAAEAMTAAGLDFDVRMNPLKTDCEIPVPTRKAVVRSDNETVLGVVGNSYVPIQNRECFCFLDEVVHENELRYHTAGALGQGERVWMLAQIPGVVGVGRTDDVVEKFLLLSNSHDGTAALRVFFTPIRVVCANTLNTAHRRGQKQGIAIRHQGELKSKIRKAREVLGFADQYYNVLEDKIRVLVNHQPNTRQLEDYFRSLYPDTGLGENARSENIRNTLGRLFEEGKGQDIPGVKGTMWAAFNAVTEYIDHHRQTRGNSTLAKADHRLKSQWFGSGAQLKTQAWDLALSLAS
jgi:phage/plasmid-like protein (TIGR03299 family)